MDWMVHSRRKKLVGSFSHIVCRVRSSWQQSRGSWDRSKEDCSRWKAGRFFTVEPVGEKNNKVICHYIEQKRRLDTLVIVIFDMEKEFNICQKDSSQITR